VNSLSPSHRSPSSAAARASADWTVLVYTCSSADIVDNSKQSLEALAQSDLYSTNVAVDWGQPDGTGKRCVVENGKLTQVDSSDSSTKRDFATPENLSNFLEWGIKQYPAKHYAVVIGGHGAGFLGCVTNGERRKMMRLPQLREALENSGAKPDLVVFNSCLMSSLETLTELSGTTPIVVGSQGPEHGLGMPLAQWATQLSKASDGTTAARALVEACKSTPSETPLVSASRTDQVEKVRANLDRLCQAIEQSPESKLALVEDLEQWTGHWETVKDFALFRQIDIGQVASRWSKCSGASQEIRQRCLALNDSAKSLVFDTTNHHQNEVGVSIFAPGPENATWEKLPLFDGSLGKLYSALELSKSGSWDETLQSLLSSSNTNRQNG
jgi:hypothetical protein